MHCVTPIAWQRCDKLSQSWFTRKFSAGNSYDANICSLAGSVLGPDSPAPSIHLASPERTVKNLFAALFLSLCASLSFAQNAPDSGIFYSARLLDPDGRQVAMSAFRGKPLVVNFWARWCPPCRAEIPELNAFRAAHGGRIEVLGIGIEHDTAAVKAFARDFPIAYPVFLTGEDGTELMRALGNVRGGLPYTLFIDRHGRVVGQKLGLLRKHDLEAVTPALLAR